MFEKNIIKKFDSIDEYIEWTNKIIIEEIFVRGYKIKFKIENLLIKKRGVKKTVKVILKVFIECKEERINIKQNIKDVFDKKIEKELLLKGKEIVGTYEINESNKENDPKYEFFTRLRKDLLAANENNHETLFEKHFDLKQKIERELHYGTFVDCEHIINKLFFVNKILIPLSGPDWNSCFEAYRYNIMDERYLSIYTHPHELYKPSSIEKDKMIRVINFSYRLMCMKSEVLKDGQIIKNNVLRIMLLNNSENRMVIFDLDIENELMIMTNRMLRDIIIDMIDTTEKIHNYTYNIRTEGFYIPNTSSLIIKTLHNGDHKTHYHEDYKKLTTNTKNIVYIPPRKRILDFKNVNFKWTMDDYDFNFDKITSKFIEKEKESSTSNIHKLSIDNKFGLCYNLDGDKICSINDFLKNVLK